MSKEASSMGEGLTTALTLVLPSEHGGERKGGILVSLCTPVSRYPTQVSCYCHTV